MRHRKETVTAVLFLLLLAAGLCYIGFQFLSGNSELRKELGKVRRDPSYALTFVESAETALNEDLDQEHGFIQLYGGFQRLTGRRVLEDVLLVQVLVEGGLGALHEGQGIGGVPADLAQLLAQLALPVQEQKADVAQPCGQQGQKEDGGNGLFAVFHGVLLRSWNR